MVAWGSNSLDGSKREATAVISSCGQTFARGGLNIWGMPGRRRADAGKPKAQSGGLVSRRNRRRKDRLQASAASISFSAFDGDAGQIIQEKVALLAELSFEPFQELGVLQPIAVVGVRKGLEEVDDVPDFIGPVGIGRPRG